MVDSIADLILPNDFTLLDKAWEAAQSSEVAVAEPNETTLLVVGNRGAGKTSLIIQAFNINEEITPTLALEYFFSMEPKQTGYNICNIWELGGGTTFSPTLFAIENMPNMTAVAMLDLSSPSTLWHSSESIIGIITAFAEKRYDIADMRQKALERIPDSHPDKNILKPCPLPLVIIGGKYDKFQEFNPEPKKVICSFLRYLAHNYFAHLVFYSNRNNNLSKLAKDVLNHHAFGHAISEKIQTDYNQQLFVPPGKDTFESIVGDDDLRSHSLENYKALLDSHFPQCPPKDKLYPENPRFDPNFKEPQIDNLRAEKDEMLQRLSEEIEMGLRLSEK